MNGMEKISALRDKQAIELLQEILEIYIYRPVY